MYCAQTTDSIVAQPFYFSLTKYKPDSSRDLLIEGAMTVSISAMVVLELKITVAIVVAKWQHHTWAAANSASAMAI